MALSSRSEGSTLSLGRPYSVLLSLVCLMAGVGLFSVVNLLRLERLTGDQFTLLAMADHEIDPSLYSRDGLFKDPVWYRSYLPWYKAIVVGLINLTGDGAMAMWLLATLLTVLMAGAFWGLFYGLKVDPLMATGGALLAILPRMSAGSEFTGAGIIECALPRTFFSVGFPLVMLLLLRTKLQGPWTLLGFLLLGLLGNFHPQSAFFASGVFLLVMLLRRWQQRSTWLLAPACALAAVGGILPFSISYPWEIAGPTASVVKSEGKPASRMDAAKSMFVAGSTEISNPETVDLTLAAVNATNSNSVPKANSGQSKVASGNISKDATNSTQSRLSTAIKLSTYVLNAINYKVNLPVLLLAVVPMIAAMKILKPALKGSADDRLESVQLCYQAAVCLFCLGVGVEIFNRILAFWHFSIPFLDSVQSIRATRLIAPLGVMGLVLAVCCLWSENAFPRRRASWAISLAILPMIATCAAYEYVYQTRYQPVREAALWAKANTPRDTLFLVDPPGALAFRAWSQRSVVWAHHDAVCIRADLRLNARLEIQEIEKAFASTTGTLLSRRARQYRVNYVLPANPKVELSLSDISPVGPFIQVSVPPPDVQTARSARVEAKSQR